jgi:hypothetical protein
MIEFGESASKDIATAKKRERLAINGIGGYSSSTLAGMNLKANDSLQEL